MAQSCGAQRVILVRVNRNAVVQDQEQVRTEHRTQEQQQARVRLPRSCARRRTARPCGCCSNARHASHVATGRGSVLSTCGCASTPPPTRTACSHHGCRSPRSYCSHHGSCCACWHAFCKPSGPLSGPSSCFLAVHVAAQRCRPVCLQRRFAQCCRRWRWQFACGWHAGCMRFHWNCRPLE